MKIAIIGGGASGLACAVELMKLKSNVSDLEVCVFEKNERVGKKLLSTGNGRCNMTNLRACETDYFEAASFVTAAFSKFPPESNIAFFENLGLFAHSDEEGRVYPLSNQASGVLDVLRFACLRSGVEFRLSQKVESITKNGDKFIIDKKHKFDKVVICAGSKASLKDFNGYDLLRQLSHGITKTAPSLVKLTTTAGETKQLKGLRAAVELTLKIDTKTVTKEKGEILFSDKVLSGIASMQLSPYVSRHFMREKSLPVVYVDFVPGFGFDELVRAISLLQKNLGNEKCENLLLGFMPKKIGEVILKKLGISLAMAINKLDNKTIKQIASLCKAYPFEISGVMPFSDAQVVTGGAKLDEFDGKTLESKKVKGLYCCGEILNVDGPCGGYNLQWAWSSARLCANSILG